MRDLNQQRKSPGWTPGIRAGEWRTDEGREVVSVCPRTQLS